ncbi:MAG: heme-binding protein [Hyphomicrobium aestuarii]|nr:heme-binding protein [Hyphomicrobium aestuarii]
MRRIVTATLVAVALALGAWIAFGALSVSGIEQPKYEVVRQADGYEVRRYAPNIIAETDMPTLGMMDRGAGFRALAGYIFGGNSTRSKVAMTAPVVMDASPAGAQKIAMTAPVVMTKGTTETGTMRPGTMRFVMPSEFKSIADLPVPNDPRVRLLEVPARNVAVAAFSWWATEGRVTAKSAELVAALARDKTEVIGAPALASYNPPFTPPFMQRHEIMVEVR